MTTRYQSHERRLGGDNYGNYLPERIAKNKTCSFYRFYQVTNLTEKEMKILQILQ